MKKYRYIADAYSHWSHAKPSIFHHVVRKLQRKSNLLLYSAVQLCVPFIFFYLCFVSEGQTYENSWELKKDAVHSNHSAPSHISWLTKTTSKWLL